MYYPVIKCFPALEVFLTIHKDVGLLPDVFFYAVSGKITSYSRYIQMTMHLITFNTNIFMYNMYSDVSDHWMAYATVYK